MEPTDDLLERAKRGVDLCRAGRWQEGLPLLGRVAELKGRSIDLPGSFFSFFGYGIARHENRVREGIQLCEHAVRVEFYNPENFFNLARTHLLAGNRRQGIAAIDRGLRVDRNNALLLDLLREAGIRRRPVIPFLSRDNPLNQVLGRVRHAFLGAPAEPPPKAG